jgi:hypothetical protein
MIKKDLMKHYMDLQILLQVGETKNINTKEIIVKDTLSFKINSPTQC